MSIRLVVTTLVSSAALSAAALASCTSSPDSPTPSFDAGDFDGNAPATDGGPNPGDDSSVITPGDAANDTSTTDAADASDAGKTYPPPTSCTGLDASPGTDLSCGPNANDDCCASIFVPGGTFLRENNGVTLTSTDNPATLSDFRLDKYEATIGRYRAFVNAGFGTQANPPVAGSGANPKIAGSGWDPTWNSGLPADTNALLTLLTTCGGDVHPWTTTASTSETVAANCIGYYLSFAFCAWDGGRLPTKAERGYAASGGSEQRFYPWSAPDAGASAQAQLDHSYANFGCWEGTPSSDLSVDGGACTNASDSRVGLYPKGNGKWGHADLAGNLWEWTLDYYTTDPVPCNDCAAFGYDAGTDYRVVFGGSFEDGVDNMNSWSATPNGPTGGLDYYGVRCAREP